MAALLPLWPVDWFSSVCCWDSSFLFFFFFFLGDAAVVSGRTASEREQFPRRGGSLAKASPPRPSAPFRLLFLLFTWWLSLTHPPGQPLLPRRQRFPCCCPPSSSHLSAGGSGRPSFLRLGLHGCPCSSPSCGAGEEAATSPVCFLFLLRRFPGGAAAAVQVSQPWSSVSAMQGFRFFLQGLWGGSLASGGWWGGAWKPPLT